MAETQTEGKSIDRELAALRLEHERLEVEDLRERVYVARRRKEDVQKQNESRIESYLSEKARKLQEWSKCSHRKGGLNLEGFARGDDNKYSIGKQRLSDGRLMLICTRCQSQWMPGDNNYDSVNNLPTDNTPSSGVQFRIETVA